MRAGAMRSSSIMVLVTGALVAGCAAARPLPEQPGVVVAMERYYVRHGIEDNGRCPLPEMTVTEASIVEQSGDRMVVDADYHWEDRRRTGGIANDCIGFGNRRFTFYQGQILAMTGEQR
jgi:hypothetical protein